LRKKSKKLQALLTAALLFFILTACSGEKAELITDEAERNLNDEYRTVITDDAASEESSVTPIIYEKYIADYNSYDELIEDIKNFLDVMEESDEDTFFDWAEQYEWFTFCMWQDLNNDSFGYLQADIDGDGVDELLLGTAGSEENPNDAYIDNMYTIRDDKVVPVFESYSERDFYELCEDGVVKYVFNHPPMPHGVEYYRCKAGNLDLIEGIHYEFEWSDDVLQNHFYYYDSSLQNRELTEKEYDEMNEELQHKYNLPKFQLHLFKEKQ